MGIIYGTYFYCISSSVIILATNIFMCFLGSALFGISVVTACPEIFVETGASVDATAASLAISTVTCAQNFGQFLCPYVINPVAKAINYHDSYTGAFEVGISLAMLIIMIIWARNKQKKAIKKLH